MDGETGKPENAPRPAGSAPAGSTSPASPPQPAQAVPPALPVPPAPPAPPVQTPLRAAPGDATLAPVELEPRMPAAEGVGGAARPAISPPPVVPLRAAGGGRTFGRYEIQQEIASGGMGRVFLARDPQLDRTVALKTILSDALVTPAQREQFLAEARNAAKLHHPHIVPIHDVGTCGDVPYFTMDVIEGRSLAAALPDLALREFLGILRDVAAALHVAHEAGIVHRDVKPANILLDAARCAFVTDFGVALKVRTAGLSPEARGERAKGDATSGAGGARGRAAADAGAGTLQYMAPEQARADVGGVDRRADVWALGVILYERLTGRRPFDGTSANMVVLAILDREPVPPSRAAAEAGRGRRVHRDLDTICLKCLAKDRARRYATAAELAAEIGRFLDGEPILARQEAWWEKGQRWVGRRKVLTGVLLALAVAGVWAVMQQRQAGIAKRAQAAAEAQREAARLSEAAERAKRIEADQEALRSLRKTAAICLQVALVVRRRGGIMREVREDFLVPLKEVADRAIARGPKVAEPHYHLGRMYRALLEFDKAAEEQDRALAKEPDYGPSLYERGVLFAAEAQQLREEKRSELLRMRASGMRGLKEQRVLPEVATDADVEKEYPAVADLKRRALANLARAAGVGDLQPEMKGRARAARGMAAGLEGNPEADRLLSGSLKEDKQLEEVYAALAERAAARREWEEAARWYEQGWRVDLGYVPHVIGLGNSLRQAARAAERRGGDGSGLRLLGTRALEEALGRDQAQAVFWEILATLCCEDGSALQARGKDATSDYLRALEAFEKALAIAPKSAKGAANQAMVYQSLGDAKFSRGEDPTDEYHKALAGYERALAVNPNSAETANNEANVHQSLGDAMGERGIDPTHEYRDALAGFDRALAINPRYAAAANNQANVYSSIGDARRARGEDPTDEYLRALAGYERALAINPDYAEAASNQATLHTSIGDARLARGEDPTDEYRKALAASARALAINPNLDVAALNQASVRKLLGDAKRAHGVDATDEYRRALEDCDRAMAINPRLAEVAVTRASVYHSLGDAKRARGDDPTEEYRAALAGYDRALTINPKLAEANVNQANVYISLGDARRVRSEDATDEYHKALAALERALAIRPDWAEAAYNQAIAYKLLGDAKRAQGGDPTDEYRRALAGNERALQHNPRLWEAHANRGLVLEALGQPADAVRAYESALAIGRDAASVVKRRLARARAAAAGPTPTAASQPPPPWLATLHRADAPIAAGNYAAARPALEEGLAGFAALSNDDRTRMLSAASITPARPALRDAHYNLACILALAAAGRDGPNTSGCDLPPPAAAPLRDTAFDHLRAAINLGFSDAAHLAADTDLAPLRADPRWPKLLESLRAR